MTIRTVVVDDQTLVRAGIRSMLDVVVGIEVVGEAGDGAAAIEVVAATCPDVVVLELCLPDVDGISTLRALKRQRALPPTLVLTTFDDDEAVLDALCAGARGYLSKDATLDQLVCAIRTLADGGTLVQPTLTAELVQRIAELPLGFESATPPKALTAREIDVLRLLAGGYANREIARALYLTDGTVKNHVSNVLRKLGVRDRTRAVLRALQLGLVANTSNPVDTARQHHDT